MAENCQLFIMCRLAADMQNRSNDIRTLHKKLLAMQKYRGSFVISIVSIIERI